MPEESRVLDPKIDGQALEEVIGTSGSISAGSIRTADEETEDIDECEPTDVTNTDAVANASNVRKKKSKKARLKKAFGVDNSDDASTEGSSSATNPASKLTTGMVEQLLQMNPSLKSEVAGMNKEKAAETVKKLDVADLLTGMVPMIVIDMELGKLLT